MKGEISGMGASVRSLWLSQWTTVWTWDSVAVEVSTMSDKPTLTEEQAERISNRLRGVLLRLNRVFRAVTPDVSAPKREPDQEAVEVGNEVMRLVVVYLHAALIGDCSLARGQPTACLARKLASSPGAAVSPPSP